MGEGGDLPFDGNIALLTSLKKGSDQSLLGAEDAVGGLHTIAKTSERSCKKLVW